LKNAIIERGVKTTKREGREGRIEEKRRRE
jgi:hypothetical protein